MNTALIGLLTILALPATLSALYLTLLTMLSARPRAAPAAGLELRFDVIVPAHDEAATLAPTLASLHRLEWPLQQRRIIVVADNCTDDTAEVARRCQAQVLERRDPARRGKGYALAYAFQNSLRDGWAQAVVVVDADSEVSSNLLAAFAARLHTGAHAVQARYGVRNPMDSWRTRLITIATSAFMQLRSRARERMGLSCGIRGNGWCVTHELLAQVPYQAYSLAEDVEYGIALGLAGHRVAYVDEAHACSEMVSSAADAGSQRRRWEDGRFWLVRHLTLPLLGSAIRQRSLLCLDLALDLLVLPLSYVVLDIVLLALLGWRSTVFTLVAAGCLGLLCLHMARGWQLSGTGIRGALDLLCVPWFLLWKLLLALRPRASGEWIRTRRQRHAD